MSKDILHHVDKLFRLNLAVVLLYGWSISIGVKTIKKGEGNEVDRIELEIVYDIKNHGL